MLYETVATPEYTIYYSFLNKFAFTSLPIRQRPTVCIISCVDEKDMRKKYADLIKLFADKLSTMEIRVFKER